MFTPLFEKDIRQIVRLQLKLLSKRLLTQHITLDATEDAVSWLSERGYDPQYGARPVKRLIQKEVLNKMSKEILSGNISTDSVVLLDAFDDELVLRNQPSVTV